MLSEGFSKAAILKCVEKHNADFEKDKHITVVYDNDGNIVDFK